MPTHCRNVKVDLRLTPCIKVAAALKGLGKMQTTGSLVTGELGYDRFCIRRTDFPGPIESVISKFTCMLITLPDDQALQFSISLETIPSFHTFVVL